MPSLMREGIGTYYYLMDDLGSVLKVVDSSGTVKNSYSYDPYGISLNKSETVTNPWQYASGYLDATTSLYKFGTRYYDPQTGRWTQKDPVGGSVGKIGSGNPYVYADNEPTMQVEPSGRGDFWACFWFGFDSIAFGIGIVISLASAIVTFIAPNPITAFFALVGLFFSIAALHGVLDDFHSCYGS